MSAVLAVARHEARERWIVLATAIGAGMLALVLMVLPWSGRPLGEYLALMLFFVMPVAAALTVGASLFSRDVADGRLSFYFARPLSAWSLWAGKVLGGLALLLAVVAISWIPHMFSEGRWSRGPGWPLLRLPIHPIPAVVTVLAIVGLMALANVVATLYRSRSRIFALDLALGMVCLSLFGLEVRHLAEAGAGRAVFGAIPLVIVVATASLLTAPAAWLAFGRTDAQRGHGALSASLWSFAAVSLVAFAGWGGWVLRVSPADVGGAGFPLFSAPRGGAVFFEGASSHGRAGFSPVFLMDGQSGSYVRLHPERVSPPAFDPEGRVAMWVSAVGPWWWMGPADSVPRFGEWRRESLMVARLDGGTPVIDERPLFDLPQRIGGAIGALAVDRDGRRVIVSGPSGVALVGADDARTIATVAPGDVGAADFLADGTVRLYARSTGPGAALLVIDWSPPSGATVERARIPRGNGGALPPMLLARRDELVVVAASQRAKAIVDLASRSTRSVESVAADFPGAALILSTGAIALSVGEELRIVARDGRTVTAMPLASGTRVFGLQEPTPGVLAVGLWSLRLAGRRTLFLDAATGAIRREEKEILPAARYAGPRPIPDPGSLSSRLFIDLDGSLIALEADGRRRPLVVAREPS